MTLKTSIAAWAGLALGVIAVIAVLFGSGSGAPSVGNTYKSVASQVYVNPYDYAGGLQVGPPTQASMRTLVRDNACTPKMNLPLAATSTQVGICSDTYVQAGDEIEVYDPLPGASYGDIFLSTGIATTSGQFGIPYENLTGAATSSFPLSTTSVQYSIYRTK